MAGKGLNASDTHGAGNEELVPKKGHVTSVVWKWVGFRHTDTEQTTVVCKVCKKEVATKTGNTTNLFHHLKLKHVIEYDECVKRRGPGTASLSPAPKHNATPAKQTLLTESMFRSMLYERTSTKWREITSAVSFYIAKDMIPIYTVEKEGFKKLLKTLDPRSELLSRKYVAAGALPKLYTNVREKVTARKANVNHFSTTTDLWSSRTMQPYMSLTVHYVEDWELKSTCLQTSYAPEDHTGETIAQGLKDALKLWKLDEDRQVCITTDNGSNVVKAVALNGWQRLQCFGHRLHLAIGKRMLS